MIYRNVKVTCVLAGPLAGQDAPYLDSLCEWRMASRIKSIQESSNGHRHAYAITGHGQPVVVDAVGKIPIPIARRQVGDLPIPLCSSPIVGAVMSESAAHYTTAFPLDKQEMLLPQEKTKIMQSGGRFKSFRLPLRTRLVERIVWFAVLREQMSDLRKLLKRVRHIGKKSAHGYGLVAEWIVEPCEQDLSWYASTDQGTLLMRPLPAELDHPSDLIGHRRAFGGCVGPYGQRDFWREIYEPC